MKDYMAAAIGVTPDRPILIDRFLHNALECEADAISDGKDAFVPAVMEHIELVEMNVVGLMNMQYAIEDGKVYVLEANPRASRTVPLVSKVCGIRMVPLATDIITGSLTGRPSPVPD